MSNLTIDQIKKSGNRIINVNIVSWTLTTIYGKVTVNYWISEDKGVTWINTHCETLG